MKNQITFLFFLCLAFTARSQDYDVKPVVFWIDPGMGTYTTFGTSSENCLSLYAGVSFLQNKTVYKFRYMRNYELDIFNGMDPAEYYNSFNFLIGKGKYADRYHLQAALGLGITSGVARGDYLGNNGAWLFSEDLYERDDFVSLSIPLELEAIFRITSFFGIGAGACYEINFTRSIILINGKLVLGKLR